jgi:hypothetical protein
MPAPRIVAAANVCVSVRNCNHPGLQSVSLREGSPGPFALEQEHSSARERDEFPSLSEQELIDILGLGDLLSCEHFGVLFHWRYSACTL